MKSANRPAKWPRAAVAIEVAVDRAALTVVIDARGEDRTIVVPIGAGLTLSPPAALAVPVAQADVFAVPAALVVAANQASLARRSRNPTYHRWAAMCRCTTQA